jgi:hypothetical protein
MTAQMDFPLGNSLFIRDRFGNRVENEDPDDFWRLKSKQKGDGKTREYNVPFPVTGFIEAERDEEVDRRLKTIQLFTCSLQEKISLN